mmetsp:Transcript_2822/g.4555  ORF Transcript_2822/g.4555 Transcript_2822/m.4555 type:complete len:95 (+) Transcript_2822:323-607(+)
MSISFRFLECKEASISPCVEDLSHDFLLRAQLHIIAEMGVLLACPPPKKGRHDVAIHDFLDGHFDGLVSSASPLGVDTESNFVEENLTKRKTLL